MSDVSSDTVARYVLATSSDDSRGHEHDDERYYCV